MFAASRRNPRQPVESSALSTESLPTATATPSSHRPRHNSSSLSLRHISFDPSDHISVVTQLNGSVWPKVWPYCLANTLWFCLVFILQYVYTIDMNTSTITGHRYMGMVMSFLVVTRVTLQYQRYRADAAAVHALGSATRQLAVTLCYDTELRQQTTPEWRNDVMAGMIRMVAKALQVLDFRSRDCVLYRPVLPESLLLYSVLGLESEADTSTTVGNGSGLLDAYTKRLQGALPSSRTRNASSNNNNNGSRRFGFGAASQRWNSSFRSGSSHRAPPPESETPPPANTTLLLTQASRVVTHEAMQVRHTIVSGSTADMSVLPLLDLVGQGLQAFSVLETHMTTPVPFPFVQMAKTLLFVWVFTIPLALVLPPKANLTLIVLYACIVCLITYGFVGLEMVAMELTDCFGDDPSDLDQQRMIEMYCEDCYLAVYKTDGRQWATRLRATAGQWLQHHRTRRTGAIRTRSTAAAAVGRMGRGGGGGVEKTIPEHEGAVREDEDVTEQSASNNGLVSDETLRMLQNLSFDESSSDEDSEEELTV